MTDLLRASSPRTVSAARARRRGLAEPVAYDFRRPIQLSREHSRMLQMVLDGFARQATTVFTSALRTVCVVSLASVDQRTYAEYIESLGCEMKTFEEMCSWAHYSTGIAMGSAFTPVKCGCCGYTGYGLHYYGYSELPWNCASDCSCQCSSDGCS